jgi:hypothetical protein
MNRTTHQSTRILVGPLRLGLPRLGLLLLGLLGLLLLGLLGLLLGAGPARADVTPSPAAPSPAAPSLAAPSLAAPSPAAPSPAAPSNGVVRASQVPLLAFYYVWFDAASWDRAKTDTPQLGRYTSDDPAVMRQHIQWAKSAGIEGFIVSWKDTTTNNRRLRLLMSVARDENFKLAMIYQGLDFNRDPLPVATVKADFLTFQQGFAVDSVFVRVGGKPLTIWSGTWAFSHDDVAQVSRGVRSSLLVLNTEKSVEGYNRIADVTDGDAYYWSSVNPQTNTSYDSKLVAMGEAVHARGQYWIAPFAPGFDARLVGGEKVVERLDGQTLRTEYATALKSSPDMLGLISWNEWSENSYVEPSQKYGQTELTILRELRMTQLPAPAVAATDSSEPGAGAADAPSVFGTFDTASLMSSWRALAILTGFVVALVLGAAFVRVNLTRRALRPRRRGRRRNPDVERPEPHKEEVHVRW